MSTSPPYWDSRYYLDHCFHAEYLWALGPAFSPRAGPVSSELSQSQTQWPLKTPGFKPCWLEEFMKFGPFCFPGQLLCGFVFPVHSLVLFVSHPFSATTVLSPPQLPWFVSLPKCVSAFTTFFDVTSFLPLVVEYVLPVFRSITGVFRISW